MLHRRDKGDDDVLTHHPVPQLQISSTDHPRASSPLDFKAEEMAEKIKMGEDSKERFAKIDKDGNMQDGVWAKIANTDAIIGN